MSTIHVGGVVLFGKKCKTLEEACRVAFTGDEIVLHKNVSPQQAAMVPSGVIIRGNNHTITTPRKKYAMIIESGKVELEDIKFQVSKQSGAIKASDTSLTMSNVSIQYMWRVGTREKFSTLWIDEFTEDGKSIKQGTTVNIENCNFQTGIHVAAEQVKISNSFFGNLTSPTAGIRAIQIISHDNRYTNALLNGERILKSDDDTSEGNVSIFGNVDVNNLTAKFNLAEMNSKQLKKYDEVRNNDTALSSGTALLRIQGATGSIKNLRLLKLSPETKELMNSLVDKDFNMLEIMGDKTSISIVESQLPEGQAIFHSGNLILENTEDHLSWRYNPKKTTVANRNSTSNLFNSNEQKQETETALEKMDKLIGQDGVKKRLREIINAAKMNNIRKINAQRNGQEYKQPKGFSNHMVFSGPAGTGKTTFARLVAQALYEGGVLKENKFIETGAEDFVAEFVGQTRPKARETIQKALDGVLFIDEAYGLDETGQNSSFNHEAVDTLIKEMENNRDRLIVIMAGYTTDMRNFFAHGNEGLQSRFNTWVEFDTYSTEELNEIMELQMANSHVLYDENTRKALRQGVKALSQEANGNGRSNGNGRFVRNYVQKVLESRDSRLATNVDQIQNMGPDEQQTVLNTVIVPDVQAAYDSLHKQYQLFQGGN
ncbi:AAA family ATPase [Ligilactobacillus equi]|uniref:Atpase of the aaa+ class n=2 Tax=Ligilactobacillus equi TaxID=137357 RepID=A0A0R1U0F3_9LACO|nr:AAA family ATPase [Ligilactobacillus equi]ETA74576.1 putative stage V sporulation protein K [Ligilactobacillus equi DPC 6820]KRL84357.1 atpase of the aaa+ class [Ligilactobacillus equi DSM 15833 = JCM 10991]